MGSTSEQGAEKSYLDDTGRDDVLSGGVKMIPIVTPIGTVRVWTKRTGEAAHFLVSWPAAGLTIATLDPSA